MHRRRRARRSVLGLNAALYSDVLVPGGGDTVACVTLRFTRDADISAAIAGLDEEGADYMSDYRTLDTMRRCTTSSRR